MRSARASHQVLETNRSRVSIASLEDRSPDQIFAVESRDTLSKNCIYYFIANLKLQHDLKRAEEQILLLRNDLVKLMIENDKYREIEQTFNKVVQERSSPIVAQPPQPTPKQKTEQSFDMAMLFKELQIQRNLTTTIMEQKMLQPSKCQKCEAHKNKKQDFTQILKENAQMKQQIEDLKQQLMRYEEFDQFNSKRDSQFRYIENSLKSVLQLAQKSSDSNNFIIQELEILRTANSSQPQSMDNLFDKDSYLKNYFKNQHNAFNWHKSKGNIADSMKSSQKTKPGLQLQEDLSIISDTSDYQTDQRQGNGHTHSLKKAYGLYSRSKIRNQTQKSPERKVGAERGSSPMNLEAVKNHHLMRRCVTSAKLLRKQ